MLEHLRAMVVFVRVTEHGSVRGAARALGLSPSVVSHHLASLETHVGAPLLYRTTRRLSLTAAGETLVPHAREVARSAVAGLDAVLATSRAPTGHLTVTAPAFLVGAGLGAEIAAFVESHPKVRLTLGFGDSPRDLLEGGFDVALRAGALKDSSLVTRGLAQMRRALVASPRYLRGRRELREPDELAEVDYVRLASRPAEIALLDPRSDRRVSVRPRSRLAVDDAGAIRALALAGVGVATLPYALVRADLTEGSLVRLLPRWELPQVPVFALWPRTTQRSALTARFVEFIAPRVARVLGEGGGPA
ncbi:MAG: LysR family transcriptional regulator [Myxococcales bacterium]|nr:LysR family transcriptional regulator [Myxococcales bacterium]MBL9113112.1 LysR family transcriptional regulator [Myxococcales bacterium]